MSQNDPESTVTTFSGQNRPKPVFPVKIDQTRYYSQNPDFPVKIDQNHFFRLKLTKANLFGEHPVFPAKIDKDQLSGCPAKTTFSVKTQFFQPKSTEPRPFGQNRPNPFFWSKLGFFQSKSRKAVLFSQH